MKMKVLHLSTFIKHTILVVFAVLVSFINAYSQKTKSLTNKDSLIEDLVKRGLNITEAKSYLNSKKQKKTNTLQTITASFPFPVQPVNLSSNCGSINGWSVYGIIRPSDFQTDTFFYGSSLTGQNVVNLVTWNSQNGGSISSTYFPLGCNPSWGLWHQLVIDILGTTSQLKVSWN